MTRKVFTSFHYNQDSWRVSQIKKMGFIEGNKIIEPNEWEEVASRGIISIENWIDNNMWGKSCVLVLIGQKTANRYWINYEINKAWEEGKAIIGIYIHNLQDKKKMQSKKGKNPFDYIIKNIDGKKTKLSEVISCYDPPYKLSKNVYNYISINLQDWIEDSILNKKNKWRTYRI